MDSIVFMRMEQATYDLVHDDDDDDDGDDAFCC
jgi:hypothetical protein